MFVNRFINYLITKDKCSVDIEKADSLILKSNRITKFKQCCSILNNKRVSDMDKELILEEMEHENLILPKGPTKFRRLI